MDTRRSRYLIAYDIADSHRLYQMHKHVEAYAIGGQKSFYECWLTEHEMIAFQQDVNALIDASDDRCIQSLKMRNKETNRDLAEFFGNKWDGFR